MASAEPALQPASSWTRPLTDALVAIGDWAEFSLRAARGLFTRRLGLRTLVPIFYDIGVNSIGVVAVTGTFIGMVLAVQSYGQFHQLGLDTSLGAIINMSVVRELGPVLAAVMLAGRVGSAMAAELATMRVTDQIDALSCLGVNPVHFLAAPRFLACLLLIPLLTILADLMGILGSAGICVYVYQIDGHHYWRHTREFVGAWDVLTGLLKSVCFGGVIALVCCHRGFHSRAGAEGVGRAATEAFVYSFVAILVLDFFLAMFTNGMYELIWPRAGFKSI
jgi:phospholipid/cholesterol/gamma-HCH transport system permease protein